VRLDLHGCGRTVDPAESEMPKQENPMNESTGEQVGKPIVRWIYSLSAYHVTGNILQQFDEELKGGIPEDAGICLGRVASVPIHSIPALRGWK